MAVKPKDRSSPRLQARLGKEVKDEVARVNLNVPLALRKRWKTAAAQAGRPMADLIVEAMDKYLNTQMSKQG